MRSLVRSLLAAAVLTAAPLALAFAPPGGLAGESGLITAAGPARAYRVESATAPAARAAAWATFVRDHGPGWRARWDADTGVPHRILGPGLPVPGATDDDARAIAAARAVIERDLGLLAPGAHGADLVLAGNDLTDGLRSVGFAQTYRGLRVVGGQVSVRIKRDRVIVLASTAWPDVSAPIAAHPIADDRARAAAIDFLADAGADPAGLRAGTGGAPVILPILLPRQAPRYRHAVPVVVDSDAPRGRWLVYVDAADGTALARVQTLHFGAGTLGYEVPERWYGGTRRTYPAFAASVSVGGAPATANPTTGALTFPGASASVTARATGSIVAVNNEAGADASFTGTLADGQTLTWAAPSSELVDAQLAVFIHGAIVKRWAKTVSSIGWLDQTLPANVNIADTCNAFSDGTTINFFRAGGGCGNTGRIADVVYHEFGHSLHNHAIIAGVGAWDDALSEGLGDFVAASITRDPAMGPGFFGDASPLRHCDPADHEQVWPQDQGEIHHTGEIYCGAMWDLRKNIVARHGEALGGPRVDKLFYESFRRADDIPSTYAELLAVDDDDGNLSNGTPHQCEIDEAYARHGLADADAPSGPRVAPPVVSGRRVTVALAPSATCAGNLTGGRIVWRLADQPGSGGTIAMTATADALAADLPDAPWGSLLEWQLAGDVDGGGTLTFPANPADPWYQTFVGAGTPIACFDFESDPAAAGWTHELVSGTAQQGADDWQWGAPLGEGGDPGAAFSGTRVMGNDLGAGDWNGQYQPDKVNRLISPPIDTAGDFDRVRLQYRRWLGVEDGSADRAAILVGDTPLWQNLAASTTHHVDQEWRLHGVDLTAQAGGSIRLTWQLTTDPGLQFGGWTIDDVCVIGYKRPPPPPDPVGPDAGTGEDPDVPAGPDAGGCGCHTDGGAGTATLALAIATLGIIVRRRRAA